MYARMVAKSRQASVQNSGKKVYKATKLAGNVARMLVRIKRRKELGRKLCKETSTELGRTRGKQESKQKE